MYLGCARGDVFPAAAIVREERHRHVDGIVVSTGGQLLFQGLLQQHLQPILWHHNVWWNNRLSKQNTTNQSAWRHRVLPKMECQARLTLTILDLTLLHSE